MRHGVLGHRADAAQQSARRAAGVESPARACGHPEGQGRRRQDAARARLHRRARRHVRRLRQGRPPQSRAGLSQGDGGIGGPLSRGRRSPDRLCHHAQRRGVTRGQELCQSTQRRGHPGADLQAPAPTSGRRPLSDPPLRLSADRRERPRRCHALRQDRARGAACAAHAVPHLHPRRLLEGIDCRQSSLGACGQGRQGSHRSAAWAGLHGLRLSAARPRQQCPRRHRRDGEISHLRSRGTRRPVCACGKSGALHGRAWGLAGRRRARGQAVQVPLYRGDHTLRARARRGARGQAGGGEGRHRQARRTARPAARGEGRLLGRAGRYPVAGRERLAPLRPGQVRRRAQDHERGGRRRGQDREVAGHAGAAGAGARALWRDAARPRHGQGGARRLRGDAEEGTAPPRRHAWRGEGGGEGRRSGQGAAALCRRGCARRKCRSGPPRSRCRAGLRGAVALIDRNEATTLKLPRRRFLSLVTAAAALPSISRIATAQPYPTRPVRLIIGYPPGGSADITARLIGQWLSERLGQPVVIESRPGAGTNIATETVVNAPPDGYTLLLVAPANAINATLYEKLNHNFMRDTAPVAGLIRFPNVIVVNPSVPAKTVPELIAYAKANPGKLNMASSGAGSTIHVSGELFKMMTGINMVHVPYRGRAPALTELISGQVQVMFDNVPTSIEFIRAGKLRPLAVTTAARSNVLPDLPTVADFVPGYEASAWYGVGVPKGTPEAIIGKLNKETNAILADPKARARFDELGASLIAGSPAEFGQLVADETGKWAKVVKFSGARPD